MIGLRCWRSVVLRWNKTSYDSDDELLISRGRNKNRPRKPTVEEDKKYVMAGSLVSISRI
jgi:hypothetical protein